jgi:redox-sensitive bicupin YhaK (pirin superfamily)
MASLIQGESKDLDGFSVNRILPNKAKKMVGPFIFLDHMGPASFSAGSGINVRPHPHIGLATLTYLLSGSMLHRDSLGNVQEIYPGDVNWMTAGRGIVHSERETVEVRSQDHALDGLQFWLALPPEKTEIEPSFQHITKAQLPHKYCGDTIIRLIAGEAYAMTSPVRTYAPMFFADVVSKAGSEIPLPATDSASTETAVYIQHGEVEIDGIGYTAGDFVLLEGEQTMVAQSQLRLMILGGERYEQIPYIRWNFVAYSRERIAQAEQDWKNDRFDHIPGDREEFTPQPGV